jgi:hypothetical protein
MHIRTYQPGDEAAQVAIYNAAAAKLPKFKAATVEEIRRRCQAPDFDPETRFYAEEKGQVSGYATFHANGRVSYPWCRSGHEHLAEPLFEHALDAMRGRGLRSAFAAYRGDWPEQMGFFEQHGFVRRRDMLNFVFDLIDLPTPAAPLKDAARPLRREDVPAVLALGSSVVRARTAEQLERHLLQNSYFGPDAAFVLRGSSPTPVAVGVLVSNPSYADPKQIDAAMPCFRLGAFGTEGMQTKRIHGLFSFLVAPERSVVPLALDLLGYAAFRLDRTHTGTVAAQVPSDALHLVGFYERYFHKQGGFPVLEREL